VTEFNPFDPQVGVDPYPFYADLRDNDPVHYIKAAGIWAVSRYDDIVQVARNHDLFSSEQMGPMGPPGDADELPPGLAESMPMGGGMMGAADMAGVRFLLNSDPPDHTKLRRLVTKPFTPSAIAELEPRVRHLCEELVDDLVAAGRDGDVDLIERLAIPFPTIVIAELMGIEPERRDDFKRWSNAMIGAMSPDYDFASGLTPMMEMWQYFGEIIAKRKADPQDDLISMLVSGPETLSETELLMFCMLLLIAGNETTTNLIGNGTVAFFNNPDEGARLRDDPSLVPMAIEEALRFDSPVQALWRSAKADVEMHGTTIPEGAMVMVLYASGNRDDRKFDEANRFDITRNPKDHVAFGSGIHFCLGAPVARLEARVAAETLLQKSVVIEPAGDITRSHNLLLRGVSSMPVKVRTA
jgi:cytochrome P450